MMKQILLLGLMAVTVAGASAQVSVNPTKSLIGKEKTVMHATTAHAVKTVPDDLIKSEKEVMVRTAPKDAKIVPPSMKAALRSTDRDGFVLYENFSDWDGTIAWVPEGWSKDHKGTGTEVSTWYAGTYEPGIPCRAMDGLYFYGIGYSPDARQDEWIITPEVEVGEGMQLSFWLYLRPAYMYDYNTSGRRYTVFNLEIMVQPEGGDWVVIKDYADFYKDYDEYELIKMLYEMTLTPDMYKETISLKDFEGKKVKVAFRYTGKDGDGVFIDGVGIGLPEIENVSYRQPDNTLYWGFSDDEYFSTLTNDMAIYPVYAPLKWENKSDADATYSWKYQITESQDYQNSNDQKELVVTYKPDYSSMIDINNNFYYPPTLTAKAPGKAASIFQAPYFCFQAGGKTELEMADRLFKCSMLPFPIGYTDWTLLGVRDSKLGAWIVPMFGYNEFTSDYWLNYFLNGAEKREGNYAHLRGIANVFWPSKEAALVLNGVNINGYGRFWADAELKLCVYAIPANADGSASTDYESFKKVAEATLKGSDVVTAYGEKDRDYIYIPFRFDEPVVVKGTDEYPAYAFMMEGFTSDRSDYFCPAQSFNPDPFGTTVGYMLHEINLEGQPGGQGKHYEFQQMRYTDEGKEMIPTGAFSIGLLGEYPWLTAETEKIVLGADDIEGVASLGSYYDGSKLSVELPEGLFGNVEGRYNECVLKVRRLADTTATISGNAVVKGPGVEVTIPVEAAPGQSSVEEIMAEGTVEAYYDLSGRKVISPEAGIYIVKYTDGKVRKVIVK